MPVSKISLDAAKPNKLFYFVANAVIYRASDRKCLVLKRSEQEKVFPGKWAIPGGKLEWDEFNIQKPDRVLSGEVLNFISPVEKLLQREIKEEAGIEVENEFHYLNKSILMIRPDGIPVVFMLFAAIYKSGEVIVEPDAFSDFRWVDVATARQLDCIEGIAEEIEQAITLLANR